MKDILGDSKAEMALARIKEFEAAALQRHPDGFYVAYSGGKDSDVLLDLVRRSGVKYTAHHHLTTCDPPELVYHVREQRDVQVTRPKETMWQLIRRKGMPPLRTVRYCCETLKEGGGAGRIVLTGVRWGESNRRSKRQMTEACLKDKRKHYLHPIIDWTKSEVWTYISDQNIAYCKLYDEGWDRLGCILCPMNRKVHKQIARWPKIAAAWERAIKASFKEREDVIHKTPQEYWEWWINRDGPGLKDNSAQIMLFDDDGTET